MLQFAHHAARERETLGRYPDLVDLMVATHRDPIADRVTTEELRVFVSPFALLSTSGFRRRSRAQPDELRHLGVPTLVIWGENERLGSVAVARAATQLIPHARRKSYQPGTHHGSGSLRRPQGRSSTSCAKGDPQGDTRGGHRRQCAINDELLARNRDGMPDVVTSDMSTLRM